MERVGRRRRGRSSVGARGDRGEGGGDGTETKGFIPDIPDDRRTEYRIGLDWGIDLFQTAAGFTEYLTWMTFNNTTPVSNGGGDLRRRIDQIELPEEARGWSPKPWFELGEPEVAMAAGDCTFDSGQAARRRLVCE